MRLCHSLRRMFDIVELRLAQGCFCGVLEDVVVEVLLVVDLVDELVDAGWRLDTAALERLWADDLAVVDNEFLVEGRCLRQKSAALGAGGAIAADLPYFCISMVSAASTSLMRSSRAATACGRVVATSSLRDACAAWTLLR